MSAAGILSICFNPRRASRAMYVLSSNIRRCVWFFYGDSLLMVFLGLALPLLASVYGSRRSRIASVSYLISHGTASSILGLFLRLPEWSNDCISLIFIDFAFLPSGFLSRCLRFWIDQMHLCWILHWILHLNDPERILDKYSILDNGLVTAFCSVPRSAATMRVICVRSMVLIDLKRLET